MNIRRVMVVAAILCVIAGCGGKSEETAGMAAINGRTVPSSEVEAYLAFKRVDPKDEKRAADMIDQYLERKALADVIEQQPLLNKAMLEAELENFRQQMLISRYFDEFLKDQVTDQAVRNYYHTHVDRYREEKVRVAHILVRTNPEMSETERKAGLTAAMEAFSKIRAGADFAEIAEIYSEDRNSSARGGDLGWIKKGSISPVFSETVFSLKSQEVSEPFETAFGFHIVRLLEGPETVMRPFEAVAGDIRHQLRTEARNAETKRLMKEIDIRKL